jgi:hypothetical protein
MFCRITIVYAVVDVSSYNQYVQTVQRYLLTNKAVQKDFIFLAFHFPSALLARL